jgi:hypothetical protein
MKTKTFRVATTISMGLTLAIAALSIIGIPITGLYPGIIVLFLVAMIPIASRFYARKITGQSDGKRNYFKLLTVINLLAILVVLWMTFVILVDRVFSKIL